jgi:hypothetical protein
MNHVRKVVRWFERAFALPAIRRARDVSSVIRPHDALGGASLEL